MIHGCERCYNTGRPFDHGPDWHTRPAEPSVDPQVRALQAQLTEVENARDYWRTAYEEAVRERDALRGRVEALREMVNFHNEDVESWLPELHALFALAAHPQPEGAEDGSV